MTPFSDMSSEANRVVCQGHTKKERRPGCSTITGEWVRMEAVRRELEKLKKEHGEVVAERDVRKKRGSVLAGRFEFNFRGGGFPLPMI